jgi:hypothetical protein
VKSAVNHLCWVPASTPSADGALMLAKWESITNHVQDIHDDHDSALFPSCVHGPLEPRAWLKPCMKTLL